MIIAKLTISFVLYFLDLKLSCELLQKLNFPAVGMFDLISSDVTLLSHISQQSCPLLLFTIQ